MSASATDQPAPSDFIRDIVAEDVRSGKHTKIHTRFPAGAERLPAHRPRQGDLPQLRHRARIRRHLQRADGRHQPGEGRDGIRRLHHGRRALADRRLGGQESRTEAEGRGGDQRSRIERSLFRLRLLRSDLRVRRAARAQGQSLRLRPVAGRDRRISPAREG